jgi:hypothetical protein
MKITLYGCNMPGQTVVCDICGQPFDLDPVGARTYRFRGYDADGNTIRHDLDVCPACLVSGPDGIRRRAMLAAEAFAADVPRMITNIQASLARMQHLAAELQTEEITVPALAEWGKLLRKHHRAWKTAIPEMIPDEEGTCPFCHRHGTVLKLDGIGWGFCETHLLKWRIENPDPATVFDTEWNADEHRVDLIFYEEVRPSKLALPETMVNSGMDLPT